MAAAVPANMGSRRAQLEVRTVLVGWRDVMNDIRAGVIPQSRESVQRVTTRALTMLDDIEREYGETAVGLVSDARAEVQGATLHELADSGERSG
jgi:hypothetical protein